MACRSGSLCLGLTVQGLHGTFASTRYTGRASTRQVEARSCRWSHEPTEVEETTVLDKDCHDFYGNSHRPL